MKFDLIRSSDFQAGRMGGDISQPLAGAVLNLTQNMWELEVKTLEELMGIAAHTGCPVVVLSPSIEGELPVLEICDVDRQ